MNSQRDPGPVYSADVVIPSDSGEARRIQEDVEKHLRASRYTDHDIFGIKLALEEALVNAIKHGNQMERARKVHIVYRIHPEAFEVHITDEGCGFDPHDVPDPTAVENLERPCGRGLMLMRHYMSEVSYNSRGNSVRMCKLRNGKKKSG